MISVRLPFQAVQRSVMDSTTIVMEASMRIPILTCYDGDLHEDLADGYGSTSTVCAMLPQGTFRQWRL